MFGPTDQRFAAEPDSERLARWAENERNVTHDPQGVALGWANAGPSAQCCIATSDGRDVTNAVTVVAIIFWCCRLYMEERG